MQMSPVIILWKQLELRAVSFWDPTSSEMTATKKAAECFHRKPSSSSKLQTKLETAKHYPSQCVNYSLCSKSKKPVLVVCMTSLLLGIQAWSLAHHKDASERDVEDFCCIQAVLWSSPTLRGLCWWCACCFYLLVSYFLNTKYFSLLYIPLSLPELEQFMCKLWEREGISWQKFIVSTDPVSLPAEAHSERKSCPLLILSCSIPLPAFLPWGLLSPIQLTDYSSPSSVAWLFRSDEDKYCYAAKLLTPLEVLDLQWDLNDCSKMLVRRDLGILSTQEVLFQYSYPFSSTLNRYPLGKPDLT